MARRRNAKRDEPKTTLDARDVKRLCKAAGVGILDCHLHWVVGMLKPTFDRRLQENPSVAVAIKKARAEKVREVASALLQKALRGDTIAMIFYLKCQGLWRENTRIDITATDAEGMVRQVRYEPLTEQEALKLKQERHGNGNSDDQERPPGADDKRTRENK